MLRQLRQNERGVVFVTVLMIIIVMMALTVSIVSLNVTQVTRTAGEVKHVQAEHLALGAIPKLLTAPCSRLSRTLAGPGSVVIIQIVFLSMLLIKDF